MTKNAIEQKTSEVFKYIYSVLIKNASNHIKWIELIDIFF